MECNSQELSDHYPCSSLIATVQCLNGTLDWCLCMLTNSTRYDLAVECMTSKKHIHTCTLNCSSTLFYDYCVSCSGENLCGAVSGVAHLISAQPACEVDKFIDEVVCREVSTSHHSTVTLSLTDYIICVHTAALHTQRT